MTRRIDISYKTIIFITAFLLLLWVLFLIKDIILLVFVSFIFMSALSPLVEKLTSRKVPKTLATFLVFFVTILIIVGVMVVGFTPLITQTSILTRRLTDTISFILQSYSIDYSVIQQELPNLSQQAIGFTLDLFQNLIGFVSVIVITFYLLLDRKNIEEKAATLFVGNQEKAKKMITIIEEKLGAWLRGQIILSVIIAVLVYVALTILGIESALTLAIIAGLLEVVPVIGPIIAAIPAILIALLTSPILAVMVAISYLAIQQIEGHVVVPQVMKRAVGLNPLLVILSIAIGGRLLGIGGALLAVPIAVVIQVVLQETLTPKES